MKKMTRKILSLIAIFSISFSLSGCGCKKMAATRYNLDLEIWGIFDDSDDFELAIKNYQLLNPSVSKITYRKISTEDALVYKKQLIDALASGKGPDIFMVNNAWVTEFKNKIVAADPKIFSEQLMKSNFIDVILDDFLAEGKVYGAPLSADSLALYYNKDLFNEAGIPNAPKYWGEFVEDVRKLTKQDRGEIVQAGAAIGTTSNINRSTDILTLLMLQNGAQMTNADNSAVSFGASVQSKDGGYIYPAKSALDFYTSFAKASSSYYTWNTLMHNSIDAFSEGKLAMMFNYSYQMERIKGKSPKLNFEVAPIPQNSDGYGRVVNYANYYGFVVSSNRVIEKSLDNNAGATPTNEIRIQEAWKFLRYLTTKPDGSFVQGSGSGCSNSTREKADPNYDPAKTYLEKTKKPAARRDLLEMQLGDPKLGVFAKQNLIAKNWHQEDAEAVEKIFSEMIDKVNKGQASLDEAISSATTQLNQVIRNKKSL